MLVYGLKLLYNVFMGRWIIVELKKYIWFFIIGILFLAVDIQVSLGQPYPEMTTDAELGEELQRKIINNFIGDQPTVDIISDVLGYLLLAIGCILMLKVDKNFFPPLLFVPIAILLIFIVPQLPYKYQMGDLYLKFAGYTFLIGFVQILIEFLLMRGIVKLTKSFRTSGIPMRCSLDGF